MNTLNGFLIVNKHKGCTSHDCVRQIRNLSKIRKVGHTGTLDPEVTGILPIALGSATRFIQYLQQDKKYVGIIKLGIKTTTDDIHGEIIKQKKWPLLSYDQLDQHLNCFRGIIQQVPPKVSSVHIRGERAYKKLLRKEDFELSSREVEIKELILKKWDQDNGEISLEIKCSAGTYIRSIARDLGLKLASEGCLYDLKRIEASGFDKTNSVLINDLEKESKNLNDFIIPTANALNHLPKIKLNDKEKLIYWETGRKIYIKENLVLKRDFEFQKPIQVIDKDNNLLGIGILNNKEINYLQPKLVLNAK